MILFRIYTKPTKGPSILHGTVLARNAEEAIRMARGEHWKALFVKAESDDPEYFALS